MAYNDDAVLARLSALNESHDSIATAAQWIMFHRYDALDIYSCQVTLLTRPSLLGDMQIVLFRYGFKNLRSPQALDV